VLLWTIVRAMYKIITEITGFGKCQRDNMALWEYH
jgi:hypothetical protein